MSDDQHDSGAKFSLRGAVIPPLIICALLLGLLAVFVFPRQKCGVFGLYSSTYMKYMSEIIREHHERDEELPPALSLIITNDLTSADVRSPWTIPRCSPQRPSDVPIGDYTLDDWFEGRVTREELWASAARSPQSGPWRSVGHYVFCVEAEALAGYGEHTIVGYETLFHRRALEPKYIVLFADTHATSFLVRELPALAEAHDGPPLPESFFFLFTDPQD